MTYFTAWKAMEFLSLRLPNLQLSPPTKTETRDSSSTELGGEKPRAPDVTCQVICDHSSRIFPNPIRKPIALLAMRCFKMRALFQACSSYLRGRDSSLRGVRTNTVTEDRNASLRKAAVHPVWAQPAASAVPGNLLVMALTQSN